MNGQFEPYRTCSAPDSARTRDSSDVRNLRVLNKVTYREHHRVAGRWLAGRAWLMGDAAHLERPIWLIPRC